MLLELRQVAERFGVHRNTILQWVAAGTFPRPIRLSRRTLRWREMDINNHIETLVAQSAEGIQS